MKNMFLGENGPLLIAEIGGNHEGNFKYAKQLANLAIESEADVVKFQIYTGDTIANKIVDPARNTHFKKFELSIEQYTELAKMVEDAGKIFMASVWDSELFDKVQHLFKIIKVGSGDLTAYPLLMHFAKTGKPIILSTGLSTEEDVLDAIKFIQGVNSVYLNSEYLAVLQCTSMYPIPEEDSNLSVMLKLKELTHLTIGYSDHTEGFHALSRAHLLGAEILEFHFTDNRENKSFRDHKVSLTKDEVQLLVEDIIMNNKLLGVNKKEPLQIEIDNGHVTSFRRAVYLSKDIEKGSIIKEEDLCVLRPNKGIDARDYYKLIGKKAKQNLNKYEILDWNYFE